MTWVRQPDSLKEGPHMSSSWWRIVLLEYYCPLLGWWEGQLRFSSWLFPLRFHCLCLCSPAPSPPRLKYEDEMVKIKPIIVRTYFFIEFQYYQTISPLKGQDRWRHQNGWIFEKGGVAFSIQKNHFADFGPFNRAFWAWNWKQVQYDFFWKWGGGQRPFRYFPKTHPFWWCHLSRTPNIFHTNSHPVLRPVTLSSSLTFKSFLSSSNFILTQFIFKSHRPAAFPGKTAAEDWHLG